MQPSRPTSFPSKPRSTRAPSPTSFTRFYRSASALSFSETGTTARGIDVRVAPLRQYSVESRVIPVFLRSEFLDRRFDERHNRSDSGHRSDRRLGARAIDRKSVV